VSKQFIQDNFAKYSERDMFEWARAAVNLNEKDLKRFSLQIFLPAL
jgi:hypothetical protein